MSRITYYVPTSVHHGMVPVARFNDAYVKVSDHEAEVARLRAEVEENEKAINVWRGRTQRAEAEVEAYRKGAERWQYARKLLTIDDIAERQRTLEEWNYLISEDECKRADEAIDTAMGASA